MKLNNSVNIKSNHYREIGSFSYHHGQVDNVLMPVSGRKYIYMGAKYMDKDAAWNMYFNDLAALNMCLMEYQNNLRYSQNKYMCYVIPIVAGSNTVINKERIDRVCKRREFTCGPINDVDNSDAEIYKYKNYEILPNIKYDHDLRYIQFHVNGGSIYSSYADIGKYCENDISDLDKASKKISLLGNRKDIVLYNGEYYIVKGDKAYDFARGCLFVNERNTGLCRFRSGSIIKESKFMTVGKIQCKASNIISCSFSGCEIFIDEPCIIMNSSFNNCNIHINAPTMLDKVTMAWCNLNINSDIMAQANHITELTVECGDN